MGNRKVKYMKLDKPIRIYHRCLDSSNNNAIIKFFYVENLIIDRKDSEYDKALECLAQVTYIERNSVHSRDINILLDRHRREGEEIVLNYE